MKSIFSRPIAALTVAIVTLLSLSSVSAADVSGYLVGFGENAHPRELSPQTRVLLSGGQYSSMITKDGKFTFTNIPEGTYLLEVQSPQYNYPTAKVTLTGKETKANLVSLGFDWSNNDNPLQIPLTLVPRAPTTFFIPREGFKISSLFANPMMLMMGASVLMLFVMPKLMANMDAESMQEMQGMQEDMQMPSFEMPDISATLAKFSTGGASSSSSPQTASGKKRQ
ncbi:ER membrane protein complex subunit 7 [Linnemannia schmuckeri]|uniref:ER membrane protein complex subunit 7 n=1 Tax=Linnemannia schmuckeri TaxID=64567 RepID=A0A9P5S5J8_9FUNG|nr:ER membrane protein complex subunit 7 [Linnemannia schmuckeri]